ncbi:PLP-dependent aminotransferase family protein [Dermatophilaceae bacterium Soc4.6]
MSSTISAHRLADLLAAGGTGGVGAVGGEQAAYRVLAEGVRRLVADGRILAGARLPSERDLTTALGVSRTTVSSAYAVLRDRGYLLSRRGSGSVVSLPTGRVPGGPLLPADGADTDGTDGTDVSDVIDLTLAAPRAPDGLTEAFEEALAALPHHLGGTGYHPFGLLEVRELVAERYTERGLPTAPGQVVLTTGALAGLSVALRALGRPGDRVVLESPTYPNAMAAVRQSGLRPVGLALDPGGLDAEGLAITLRQSAARLAYLVPDFHNPTGALVDEATRAQVASVLRRHRAVALVDETPAELLVDVADGDMPRPLAAFDDRAISIGSASKTFWGGLRVGWLRAPVSDVPRLQQARLSLDLGAPLVEQLALAALLRRRHTVIEHRRRELRASRDALVGALRTRLPDWRFTVPAGGLCLWCELPQPRSSALVEAGLRHGVRLAPGGSFGVDGGLESFCRIPMAQPAAVLVEAVERIARAWGDAQGATVHRTSLPALIA